MKRLFVLCVAVILTACATSGVLREKGAVAKFKSTKNQSTVAACIRETFEDNYPRKFIDVSQRNSGATSISYGDPGSPIRLIIVDVSTTGAGTESRLYVQATSGGQWIKFVSECQ